MDGDKDEHEQARPEEPFRVLMTPELAAKMLDAADQVIGLETCRIPPVLWKSRIEAMLKAVADN
jgi:hypothetical protein